MYNMYNTLVAHQRNFVQICTKAMRLRRIYAKDDTESGVRKDTRPIAHGGLCPPQVYLGEQHYNFLSGRAGGQACPPGLILTGVHPEPPLHLAHTLVVSRLNSPWPTGAHVLKVKI